MGGCNSDDSFNAPQCLTCHEALGNEGAVTFFAKRGIDKDAVIEHMRMLVADSEQGEGLAVHPLLAWLDS